jgi:hypothetical protein
MLKENQAHGKSALLVLYRQGEICRSWPLKKETALGRQPDNDVVIDDRWISRHHARIVRRGSSYLIEDLNSKNGTFVNGQPLSAPRPLQDGDQIQLAPHYRLTFVDAEATMPVRPEGPGLRIDADERRVWVYGQELSPPLSPVQFALLALLAGDPDRVFSRDAIVAAVWPDVVPDGVSTDAVDSLIRRLRKRLSEADPDHDYIVSVRGHGYRLAQFPREYLPKDNFGVQ